MVKNSRLTIPLTIGIISFVLIMLPGRAAIPPLIESDYCHLFTAVDRAIEGLGFTATQPVAPFQPWQWRSDWEFLTRWPIGYPALLYAVRFASNASTTAASQVISVFAISAAIVGWTLWVFSCLPRSAAAALLAFLAACSAISINNLVNPSTDILVIAALPYILFAARNFCSPKGSREESILAPWSSPSWRWIFVGVLSGSLFWIRYASLFVPLGIGLYLALRPCVVFRRRVKTVSAFAASAIIPIVTLILINASWGVVESAQARLNLGHRAGFNLTWLHFLRAWTGFANIAKISGSGMNWLIHYAAFAALPVLLIASLCFRRPRRALSDFYKRPGMGLSLCMSLGLLGFLVAGTALFGSKYDYLGLDRYYLPVRPLFLLLFLGPVLLIRAPIFRFTCYLVLIGAANWTIYRQWVQPYQTLLAKEHLVTSYGQRSKCFGEDANLLYSYLKDTVGDDALLISNFNEWVTLETKISTAPIPTSTADLLQWLESAGKSRGVSSMRALFVLDPDPKWRSYWIPPTNQIISNFNLVPVEGAPPRVSDFIYELRQESGFTEDQFTFDPVKPIFLRSDQPRRASSFSSGW